MLIDEINDPTRVLNSNVNKIYKSNILTSVFFSASLTVIYFFSLPFTKTAKERTTKTHTTVSTEISRSNSSFLVHYKNV